MKGNRPFGAIIGYAELLLQEGTGPLTDEQRIMLETIRAKAGFLVELRQDALDKMKEQTQPKVNGA